MIESIDWPSFGYGAGALVVSSYAGSQGPRVVRWWRRRLAAGREHAWHQQMWSFVVQLQVNLSAAQARVSELEEKLELQEKAMADVEVMLETIQPRLLEAKRVAAVEEELKQKTAELQRLASQDVKWAAYQARKKGLPVGRGAASPTFWTRR